MIVTFTIPFVTPSLNVWQRLHFRKRAEMRTMFGWACKASLPASWTMPTDRRVRVTIVRASKQSLDRDNLWAGCKPLLDGLCDARAIADDTEQAIDLIVRQEPSPHAVPITTITLEVMT